MDAREATRKMMLNSGRSEYSLSIELSPTGGRYYLESIWKRGTNPRTDTMAKIADACGYDLLLRNRQDGSEITINPPEK